MHYLAEGRAGFEALGNHYAIAPDVEREDITIAGVPCAWLKPAGAAADHIAVYLHGGGFIFGSVNSHAPLVSHIAQALQCNILIVAYRLAPEHPFPAGLADSVAVIEACCAAHPGLSYGIIGDSAGGNLVFAAQLMLKQHKQSLPQYSIVISPWVNLECTYDSFNRNRAVEQVLSREYLLAAAAAYAGDQQLSARYLSPVHAALQGFPPALILCGTAEILEDDSVNLHKRLLECGVAAELQLFKGEQHVWPFMDIATPAARRALKAMAAFVAGHRKINATVG